MRTGNNWSGRPEYHDRNALTMPQSFSWTTIAGADSGEQLLYTVPTAREAFVAHAYLNTVRLASATTLSDVQASIHYQKSSVVVGTLLATYLRTNSIGVKDTMSGYQGVVLEQSEAISFRVIDSSVGGNCGTGGSVLIVEFDA